MGIKGKKFQIPKTKFQGSSKIQDPRAKKGKIQVPKAKFQGREELRGWEKAGRNLIEIW